MSKYAFNESELNVKGYVPNRNRPDEPGKPILDFPCTAKEATNAMYRREAVWVPYGVETNIFCPEIIPDNIARGFVLGAESKNYSPETYGGKDMFGVEWVFVPVAGGSMEKPGNPHPLGDDVSGWKEKLTFPDIDSWDWDKSARDNEAWLDNGKANIFWFLNGMGFERLISFMGFEGAAMAMLDEDQEDDLKDLLESLTDLHIKLVDKVCETYGDAIDGFTLHDDWGSQRSPFFSEECAETFLVPQMKRFTDHVKSKGKFADLHSCGHIEDRIACIINGGWQSWSPMPMNDTLKLQEEYGDKIIIGCVPNYDPEKSVEENAADFVKKYYRPDRPCTISNYGGAVLSEAFAKAVYKLSRQM
ncbi:MAG: uroporphyrinogen decarboxylase family protein [Lachnospiraceae bacterium]|nr:uroporphyrinogen decarboxylase family protein [Lachnospiraceae bacterium]